MRLPYPTHMLAVRWLVLTLLCASVTTAVKLKSVTTLLDAKWQTTPLLLEVAEYVAEDSASQFWGFVDAVAADEEYAPDSEKEQYEYALSKAAQFISPAQTDLLKFATSLRYYSPKLEMYYQMALNRDLPDNCAAVADVQGTLTCNPDAIKDIVLTANGRRPDTYLVDHHYPGSENKSICVVLYAEIGTDLFRDFHKIIKPLALEEKVDYVLRHYVKERPDRRLRLSGYGVELQIKSTEYRAQDDTKVEKDNMHNNESDSEEDVDDELDGFRFGYLKDLYPHKKEELERLRLHFAGSSGEVTPLKAWQLQELSLQAAQKIMTTPKEDALKVMAHISQNFPLLAPSIVRTSVPDNLRTEVLHNQEYLVSAYSLTPSDAAVFVNGLYFDVDVLDIFTLFDSVRQEMQTMEGLHKIGIKQQQLNRLLALELSTDKQNYAVDIRDSAIQYVNDIENDPQYRRWPTSVTELLRPTYPGMLRTLRKNVYHLVLIVNPAEDYARPLIKLAESFILHNVPLRLGIVFAVNSDIAVTGFDDGGVALLEAFNYIAEKKDRFEALSFITDVYAAYRDGTVLAANVLAQFKKMFTSVDREDVFGEESEFDVGRQLAKDYTQRTGLVNLPQVLLNGIPLPEKDLNIDGFEEAVLNALLQQTGMMQRAVFKGELTDSDVVVDYLMNKPHIMPRLNNRVLQNKGEYIDLTGDALDELDWERLEELNTRDSTATLLTRLPHLTSRKSALKPVTNWVIADVEDPLGRELVRSALERLYGSDMRLAIIFNPSVVPQSVPKLSQAVQAALHSQMRDVARDFILKLLQDNVAVSIQSGEMDPTEIEISDFDVTSFQKASEELTSKFLHVLRSYSQKALSIMPGHRAVVSNGKIIGPFAASERFDIDDFNLLERYAFGSYAERLVEEFQTMQENEDNFEEDSIQFAQTVSLLMSRSQTKMRMEVNLRSEEHSVLDLPPSYSERPALDIIVSVDPVSRGAQKIAPILSVLKQVVNSHIRVFFNCIQKHSEMPLRSFYRFVLEPELQFDSSGELVPIMAKFTGMPTAPLLTQNFHVPDNWLVGVVRAVNDLDNIHLEDIDGSVHSDYELEHLLVEGHCFELQTGNPPRGLQITLGTPSKPVVVDTIVMANLGYLQLKANPGSWLLQLRQGRSADIYDIASHENTDTPANSTDIHVVLSSFRSLVVKLKVMKKPGKEKMDLLSDDQEQQGIWSSITSSFSGKDEEEDEPLNIFSLASGHLYERFLRIMMLSVLKNTKSPVKFWFLENYLSPTFKDFLPHMSKEYGFEYQLVQYKWPRWLHGQTEKQRIIWGYKILFLDVLFPLDVKKIIFVDADQVVRADMKELRDLDLGGAPYGYTPFCDDRKEMDGFRFWKAGYWRSHLQGRKYHISALYVVDLKKFRRIAAGDRLRGQYQALSQDPNSLSNLDQDLPNNMIHQVAIKSLPREWLWCETWCSDESKAYAKTIDLCNNPLTKEAKLSAAVRIVDEWKSYDEEIKSLQERIALQKNSSFSSPAPERSTPEHVPSQPHGGEL